MLPGLEAVVLVPGRVELFVTVEVLFPGRVASFVTVLFEEAVFVSTGFVTTFEPLSLPGPLIAELDTTVSVGLIRVLVLNAS